MGKTYCFLTALGNGKTFSYHEKIPGKEEMTVGAQYTAADPAMVIPPRDPHWTRHPPELLEQSFCTWLENAYIHIAMQMYTHGYNFVCVTIHTVSK